MNPIEQDLLAFCQNVFELKITERKRKVDLMRERLADDDIVKLINKNSSTKDSPLVTWDKIFIASHKALKAEADRVTAEMRKEKKSNTVGRDKVNYMSLISAIASKANAGSIPLLSCNNLLSCSLEILERSIYRRIFGEGYIRLLLQYVLPIPLYWKDISLQHWIDLFDLAVGFYKDPPEDCSKDSIVELLDLIVNHGCGQSHLALKVKKRFSLLTEIVKKQETDLHESVLHLALTYCQRLGTECHKAICTFAEETMSLLLNSYGNRCDDTSRKKNYLIELLVILVQAHHPGDAVVGSDEALAGDWDVWKRHLLAIYCLVQKELYNYQISRRSNYQLNEQFITLAVAVMKQVYTNFNIWPGVFDVTVPAMNDSVLLSAPNAKRRRIEASFQALLEQLVELSNGKEPLVMWPWLAILTELLNAHPDIMNEKHYLNLLQFLLEQMMSQKASSVILDHCCRCCVSLLKVENHLKDEICNKERIHNLWAKISDTVLRMLELNQCETSSFKLAEEILKFDDEFLSRLLKLYSSRVLHVTQHTLRTLVCLCQTTILQDELGSENCKHLLHWMLINKSEILLKDWKTHLLPIDVLSRALVGLIIRTKLPATENIGFIPKRDPYRGIKSLKSCYVNSYEDNLIDYVSELQNGSQKNDFIVNWMEPTCVEFIQLLFRDTQLLLEQNTDDIGDFCIVLLHHSTLLIELGSLLELLHFPSHERIFGFLSSILNKLEQLIENLFLNLKKIPAAMLKDIIYYVNLFGSRSKAASKKVAEFLFGHSIRPLFLRCLWTVINHSERSQLNSGVLRFPLDYKSLNEKNRLQVDAMQAITLLVCPSAICMKQDFSNLISLLDALSKEDIRMPHILQMYIILLEEVSKMSVMDDMVVMKVLYSIRFVCITWSKVYCVAPVLLNVLRNMVFHVWTSREKDNSTNFLILITQLFQRINSKRFGTEVTYEFVELLGCFIKMDWAGEWAKWDKDEEVLGQTPVSHMIFNFLRSPFHQVRVAAGRLIGLFFSFRPVSDIQKHSMEMALERFTSSLNKCFIIDNELSEEEMDDESVNRIFSVLNALANVLVNCPRCRSKVLFTLMVLVHEKKIKTDLVLKVLKLVEKTLKLNDSASLIENTISSLFYQWHEKYNTFKDFPWTLMNCSSEKEFYLKWKHSVVPVLLYRNNMNLFEEVTNKLQISRSDLIKDCYIAVMIFILSTLSSDSSDVSGFHHKEVLINVQHLLGDDINRLLTVHLAEIIVNILRNLYDPEELFKLCSIIDRSFLISLPDPEKIQYSFSTVNKIFDYLQVKLIKEGNIHLVIYLSEKRPDVIEKILLQLYSDIYVALSPEFQFLSFHRYITMCEYLGRHLADDKMKELSSFIVCRVVHTLLHLISWFSGLAHHCLLTAALSYLKHFLHIVLPTCADIINSLLHHIVTTVLPFISSAKDIRNRSVEIIYLLVVENHNVLPGIAKLDPLPDDQDFETILNVYNTMRFSYIRNDGFSSALAGDIKHFLEAGEHQLNHSCRLEGLKHLRIQLSTRKDELSKLCNELNSVRKLSNDCSESILHQLICMLVGLSSSADICVATEAARCLGELGPVDLTTLVLQAERPQLAGTVSALTNQMVVTLSNLLLDPLVDVSQAASKALYRFVKTRCGFKAAANLKDIKKKLLIPFMKLANKLEDDVIPSGEQMNLEALANAFTNLCPNEQMSHKQWITNLAQTLLEQFPKETYIYKLIPICLAKVSFSEDIILYIIHLIFLSRTTNEDQHSCIVSVLENVSKFLQLHFDCKLTLSDTEQDAVSNIYGNRASVRTVLNMATAIHHYTSHNSNGNFTYNYQLNYLHVAKAAQFCSAFFTSVFYGELWFYTKYSEIEDLRCMDQNNSCGLEYVKEKNLEDGLTLLRLLFEAYKRIGEPDAVYGCVSIHLLDPDTRIQHHMLEKKWDRVMETYDLELPLNNSLPSTGLASAIISTGLYNLAGAYATAVDGISNSVLSEIQYESAWRLGQWTLPESKNSYHGFIYSALRAVNYSDNQAVSNAISGARNLIISSLRHSSLESAHSIYKYLSQLQALQQIEDFQKMNLEDVLKKWKLQDYIEWVNFDLVEPIFAQRIVLTGIRGGEEQVQVCLQGTRAALTENHYSVAARSLYQTKNVPHLSIITQLKIKLEEARVYWARGDTNIGRVMLKSLIAEMRDVENVNLKNIYSCALRIYGSWMAETRSENAERIVKNYLEPAYEMVSESNDLQKKLAAMSTLARYTDLQYQAISQYTKSADFQKKVAKISKAEENINIITSNKSPLTPEQKKAHMLLKNQSVIDGTQITNTKTSQEYSLNMSVKFYLKCLVEGEDVDVCIFRVVSLWLENKMHKSVCSLLSKYLTSIPSYKFLMVLPQLAAHITDSSDNFSTMLLTIFERCAIDHPHHTIPIILALANSYKDTEVKQTKRVQKKKEEGRVSGSLLLLNKLIGNSKVSQVVKGMKILAEAYIDLANSPVKTKETVMKLAKTDPILKVGQLPQVLVSTITLPYNKTANYENIVGIHSFENYYEIAGGVNKPKKISCIGTDGIKRTQLVKGNDDLRQDAVMMQVFTILNSLLQKNKRTNQRKLVIRTYKVVPMSQRSGVIEWCLNAQEVGQYLVGRNKKDGAHYHYRPNDTHPSICRQYMSSVAAKPKEVKLQKFNEICQMIFPVMHHYFTENYFTPGEWFEKRLAYTHSVACSSMIGYILGLGDRHVNNILIDKGTAELIHIDFGIAFEMGRCLPTPETVPFRLTRDIVDGMGISGVEGVFRRCCEETMVVLRNSQETIMTILEVLLYDPLYTWTALPQKIVNEQMKLYGASSSGDIAGSSEVPSIEVNEWAECALLRLKQKLQGTEEGSTGPTSVEGQVEWLIQESRDPANLCCIYQGWQAYL